MVRVAAVHQQVHHLGLKMYQVQTIAIIPARSPSAAVVIYDSRSRVVGSSIAQNCCGTAQHGPTFSAGIIQLSTSLLGKYGKVTSDPNLKVIHGAPCKAGPVLGPSSSGSWDACGVLWRLAWCEGMV